MHPWVEMGIFASLSAALGAFFGLYFMERAKAIYWRERYHQQSIGIELSRLRHASTGKVVSLQRKRDEVTQRLRDGV